MIYFLLFACILLLVFIYAIYFVGKKIPRRVNWFIVYSPMLFGSFIIGLYLLNGTSKPLDIRKVEYTAFGMKHYIDWSDNRTSHRDMFTGIYKNSYGGFDEFEIPRGTYNYFKNLWKDKKEFSLSSDSLSEVFFLEWDKDPKTALIYTRQEPFTNYFKTSMGLYDFYEVTQKQARDEKLYSRGRVDIINSLNILEPRQSLVYGLSLSEGDSRSLSNVSSLDPEFRPIICVWVDSLVKDPTVTVKHQRSFWEGGKNNEVIFCVGIDDLKSKSIKWVDSFSWSITPDFEKYVIAESLKVGDSLDIEKYRHALVSGFSKGLWNPRNFEAYTVLSIPITDFTVILSCILVIIVNILMSIKIGKRKK